MLGHKILFYFLDFSLVLFQTIQTIQVTEPYHLSDNTLTWINAMRNCSLATPTIDYASLSVEIPHGLVTEDVWVGYYLKTTAFRYIGCMLIGNHEAQAQYSSMSVGRCQSICGSTMYIGVTRTSCFCVDREPTTNIRQLYCTDTCRQNLACGGKGYMSLYEAVQVPRNITYVKEVCLSFENNIKYRHFQWEKCETYTKTICEFDNGTVSLVNGESRPWNVSVQECLRNKGQPTSYEKSLLAVKDTGPVWTGLIKGRVIHKLNAVSSTRLIRQSQSTETKFGYIKKDLNGKIFLRFDAPEQKLRALCIEGKQALNKDTDGNESLAISVGVSIPAALVIIALVIAFVILKRRGRIPNICKDREMANDTGYTDTNFTASNRAQPRSHINQAYGHHDVIVQQEQVDHGQSKDTSYSHTFEVQEKRAKEPNDRDASYYTSITGHCPAEMENISVHNTVNSDDNTTYDCTFNTRKNITTVQKRNDTYDSLNKTGKISYNTEQADDGTYNHIVSNKEQNSHKPDNTYGIPNQFTNPLDNPQNDGDIYNHLNSKAVKNIKPDNVYGIPEL